VSGFVLCSHDGFGVGHVRRHVVVGSALRAACPGSRITLVTGLPFMPVWLWRSGFEIVRVPAMLKDATGSYSSPDTDVATALARREALFFDAVERQRPDVVLVDRHPFGTGRELYAGLRRAKSLGAHLVLGLRDILDDPAVVRSEIAGGRWVGVSDVFDEAIVYGSREFCDHSAEYGLSLPLTYCGWAVQVVRAGACAKRHLIVTSGGGADGHRLFELGVAVAERLAAWRVTIAAGGYTDRDRLEELVGRSPAAPRIGVVWKAPGCAGLFATTEATLQMAGYNSTFEALAAGRRPILVPRRHPRTEQAIRAERLAGLGVADVVEPDAVDDVCELLSCARSLPNAASVAAGLTFDGAQRAASLLVDGCVDRAPVHASSART
jgi:predicted glycosyltransferase